MVVLWVISLPFGKFFHLIERPATVGIDLYRRTEADLEMHHCPQRGQEVEPALFMIYSCANPSHTSVYWL